MENNNKFKVFFFSAFLMLTAVASKAQDVNNPWHLVVYEQEQEVAFYNTEFISKVNSSAQQVTIVLNNGKEFSYLKTTSTFGFDPREAGTGTANAVVADSKWNVYYADGKLFFSEMVNQVAVFAANGTIVAHFTGNFTEVPVNLRQGFYVVHAGGKSAKLLVHARGGHPSSQSTVGVPIVASDISILSLRAGSDIKTWWNICAGDLTLPVEMSQVVQFLFTSDNEIEFTLINGNTLALTDYKKMEFDSSPIAATGSDWDLELTLRFGGSASGYDSSLDADEQHKTYYVTAFSDRTIYCYDVINNIERRFAVSFIPTFEARISMIRGTDDSLTPVFSTLKRNEEDDTYVVEFFSIENGDLVESASACGWSDCSNLGKTSFSMMGNRYLKTAFEGGEHLFTASDGRRAEWSHVGPGGGGAQFNPTISPHDPKTVFVTCDMGGAFVTYDGGESWRMFNLSHSVEFFVFDPVDPDVVYAKSYALFKSSDKGLTWHLIYPHPSDVEYVLSKGDHASERIILKDYTSRSVTALAIDPTQSKNMYAAIRTDESLALYTSVDGGISWDKEKDFNHDIWDIFIDPSSPADRRTLYVTWSGGVDQRVDSKWSSYGVPNPNVRFNIFSGGYDGDKLKYILYALSGKGYLYSGDNTELGIFVSEDGGKTWENLRDGLLNYTSEREKADLKSIATSAHNPSTVYISYENFTIEGVTYCFGVAKSEDYGKSWRLPWKEYGSVTMSNYSGCWLSDRFSSSWGGSPFSFGVAPTDANVCYGSDYGRTIKTENGGSTWEAVYTKKLLDNSWTTRGIEVTTGYDVVFDPFDINHIFFALTDIGLMESKNGGQGWLSATRNNGVPGHWVNTTYAMVFDPEVKGRAWAAMSGIHDLPVPKMFRNGGIDRYTGGIVLTNDGGANWQLTSASISEAAMTHILLDPTSNKDSRTLYACAFGKGVYKSTNGGRTWVKKNNGLAGAEPFAWRIERRESDGTLFLIVSRRSADGSIGNDWDGALYRSTDDAESWTKMTLPEGCNGPTSLIVDHKNPKRLVLSAWGKLMPNWRASDTGGGIYVSDNDGLTWTQVMAHDQHIYAVSLDPRNGRYYACGFNASVYYSEDGAMTWNRSKGYNFKWGHRVIPDPRDPEMVFVVTFGGGVWHGPAKGDPEASEDLLTPLERR